MLTQDELRGAIHDQFRRETVAMHQEFDALSRRDHQEAARCHLARREALVRAGVLMDEYFRRR
jgi:hypothetical protein